MQIVICTGIGLILVIAGIAATVGILTLGQRILQKLRIDLQRISRFVSGAVATLILIMLAVGLLMLSHDAGCRVIHFAMGHR